MHIYVSMSHLHTHHKTSQGKKTREREATKREKNKLKTKESQTTLICKNSMICISSSPCMHTHMRNEEETYESKNSNSITNGFFEQGMWFKEVATIEGNSKTKILLHIITLKMHILIHKNKLTCMITFTLKVTHAYIYSKWSEFKNKYTNLQQRGSFQSFIFIMPISIFLSLVFFRFQFFFLSFDPCIFFLYSFTTYQCYLFFCVHKLCENQSKMNSFYFVFVGAISMVDNWQILEIVIVYETISFLRNTEEKQIIRLHSIWTFFF